HHVAGGAEIHEVTDGARRAVQPDPHVGDLDVPAGEPGRDDRHAERQRQIGAGLARLVAEQGETGPEGPDLLLLLVVGERSPAEQRGERADEEQGSQRFPPSASSSSAKRSRIAAFRVGMCALGNRPSVPLWSRSTWRATVILWTSVGPSAMP